MLRPDLVKGKWTDEEDDRLRTAVLEGFDHWGKVAEKMPGRTAKQCRERWTNYLDPTLLKTPFTPPEDDLLVRLQAEMGNKWAAISRQLPGRTENSVKLRFNALMKLYGERSTDRSSNDGSGTQVFFVYCLPLIISTQSLIISLFSNFIITYLLAN